MRSLTHAMHARTHSLAVPFLLPNFQEPLTTEFAREVRMPDTMVSRTYGTSRAFASHYCCSSCFLCVLWCVFFVILHLFQEPLTTEFAREMRIPDTMVSRTYGKSRAL
jgi:hypothetical protein